MYFISSSSNLALISHSYGLPWHFLILFTFTIEKYRLVLRRWSSWRNLMLLGLVSLALRWKTFCVISSCQQEVFVLETLVQFARRFIIWQFSEAWIIFLCLPLRTCVHSTTFSWPSSHLSRNCCHWAYSHLIDSICLIIFCYLLFSN